MIGNVVLGVTVLGTVLAGGVAVDAATAPEAKAAARWGQITQTQGKNYTGCGKAQHFNRFKNGTFAWGNVVGANAWSKQKLCYANISQYGMARA
ncbi:hypothetical protein [Curtobacterium sp. ISL-83]|uniref:hypothetical protein n=1 Tax=Curtobacterium sp. ISL-83 TaxID=2819145 RepID=UPI001BED2167|nr:hypothetical protein [Curtobacterium sp. ISL-83]MBT2502746.1 hypothetical protein [Curtobacterium sp. ISL-83]